LVDDFGVDDFALSEFGEDVFATDDAAVAPLTSGLAVCEDESVEAGDAVGAL
jgi:hypothetical protein